MLQVREKERILILGVSGMLGSALFKILKELDYEVFGTVRSTNYKNFFNDSELEKIITNIDVQNHDDLVSLFGEIKPTVVINCVGVIKQKSSAKEPLVVIPINSLLPHKLSNLCFLVGARLILISTDCVFNGEDGNYLESDVTNAVDLYGVSKALGEIRDQGHVVTIRTSIIGHEINSNRSLLDWFLNSNTSVKGYQHAIFSGLPTNELAKVIGEYVIPNLKLKGLYHVSVDPIAKYNLLSLVKEIYSKDIEITPSDDVKINRSLNSDKFKSETGYIPPNWKELIKSLYEYKNRYLRN
ncbi:dTDP-4-dehydrorhamnose reductase family protein [Leptospira paudalimensis]|uniref:dTDP-4-dehydrorhamnose reductase n=1 Tax=Leptospira paudalimensis TaxID=2950024 RepID=A0ABT3M5T9_9LEPT|nr:SDR family oxidoreductase [Leptospira paudalimensis]MCW7503750.1 SDR family oxidoreductase [Leptospira paudalimensis]